MPTFSKPCILDSYFMLIEATYIDIYVNIPEQFAFSIFRMIQEDYPQYGSNKFLRNIITLKAM
jgi:hypothetical protein